MRSLIAPLSMSLFFVAGCPQPVNLGNQQLGQEGQPPRIDGSCDAMLMPCDGICRNLAGDAAHCGQCGAMCGMGQMCVAGKCQGNNGCNQICMAPHAKAACAMGQCAISACDAGFADCDQQFANGCEVATDADVNNCGGCGMRCAGQCVQGVCMPQGCGFVCQAPHAQAKCVMNMCVIGQCDGGFADCDQQFPNGCEVDVTSDAANCGACGQACPMGQGCKNGVCANNGGCNQVCIVPNAQAGCVMGLCAIISCNQGFADCDLNYPNGCEVNLLNDANNCGGCGMACMGPCVQGRC